MRYAALFLLAAFWSYHVRAQENEIPSDDPCINEEIKPRCTQKDYRAYVRCIKGRVKRQVCPFAAQQAAQQQLQMQPEILAQMQQPPQLLQPQLIPQFAVGPQYVIPQPLPQPMPQVPQCQMQYNSCVNQCPNQACQAQCPYTCSTPTNHVFVGSPNDNTAPLQHVNSAQGHNITTVIKLTNLVNNTNIVNVPTSINSTNINNININGTYGHGEWGLGANKAGSCCIAVQPRSCGGTSCRHARRRTCGPQCSSRVIHAHNRHGCRGSSCHGRTVYVPQPKPSCAYSHVWPYVNCGNRVRRERSCNGCYEHYGYGHHAYYASREAPNCQGCYDDGHDQGPLYRQGPVYQPGYYHQPPMFPYMCGPFGCFGNQFVDPFGNYGGGYGNRHSRHHSRTDYDYDQDYSENDYGDVQYVDEDEFYSSLNKTYGGSNCTIRNNVTGESIPCASLNSNNPYIKHKLSQPTYKLQNIETEPSAVDLDGNEVEEKIDEIDEDDLELENERPMDDYPPRHPRWRNAAHRFGGHRRFPQRRRPHENTGGHLKPWEPERRDFRAFSE